MENNDLIEAIDLYNEKNDEQLLDKCFYQLAEQVFTYFQAKKRRVKHYLNKDEYLPDLVDFCWDRLGKYNIESKKPFNYFTTSIMCYLQQISRIKR